MHNGYHILKFANYQMILEVPLIETYNSVFETVI